MEAKKRTARDLRIFAVGIFVITGLISALLWYKGKPLGSYVLGGFSAWGLISIALPVLIVPLFIVFSFLGLILGWINTRLLLGIIFYLVFTPLAIIFRLFGRDLLDRRFDNSPLSHWKTAKEGNANPEQYEKQF